MGRVILEDTRELIKDSQELQDTLARIGPGRGLSVQPAGDRTRIRIEHSRQITLVKLNLPTRLA
jgi:hypothetical protein